MNRMNKLDLRYRKRYKVMFGITLAMIFVTAFSLTYTIFNEIETNSKINKIIEDKRIPRHLKEELFNYVEEN